jgi:hypothetical protein
MDGDLDQCVPGAELDVSHIHTVGVPVRGLRVRYRSDGEVPGWQDGPTIRTAIQDAESRGWRVYDRKPGAAPGEFAVLHLIRESGREAGGHQTETARGRAGGHETETARGRAGGHETAPGGAGARYRVGVRMRGDR